MVTFRLVQPKYTETAILGRQDRLFPVQNDPAFKPSALGPITARKVDAFDRSMRRTKIASEQSYRFYRLLELERKDAKLGVARMGADRIEEFIDE